MEAIPIKVVHDSRITWKIENIESWNTDIHDFGLSSPDFILNNLEDSDWHLIFIKEKDNFDVYLTVNDLDQNVSFICDWSLIDENGKTVLSTPLLCNASLDDLIHPMFQHSTLGDITLYRNLTFLANNKLTVRLIILNDGGSFPKSECVSIVTRLLEKPSEECFVWRIEKLCTWQLKSEATATVCFKGISLRLRIFMTGKSLDDAVLNFGISIEDDNLKSLKVKISFLKDHKRCVQKKHEYHSTKCKQTFVVSKLVSRREILEAPSDWLRGDDLTFIFKFEYALWSYIESSIEKTYLGPAEQIDRELKHSIGSRNAGKETKQCPRTIVSTLWKGEVQTSLHWIDPLNERGIYRTVMGEDFFSAYSERILCDFELLAGEQTFQVHKVVLCARSQLFRAFLSDDDTKLFRVPDLDADILRRFVAFLYSGTLTDDTGWCRAVVLYEVADKYKVPTLKLECSEVLQSNIVVSNVCDILELAERLEDEKLMDSVLDFVEDNFDDVIFSDEWDRFLERSYLAGKTMREICKRKVLSTSCF